MDFSNCRTDLPVILLYDLNPAWPQAETDERGASIQRLRDALCEVGHPVQAVSVQTAALEFALKEFNPDEHLILNWCEELPGISYSESRAAQLLEHMGFTFTGASARTLAIGQDKRRVKRLLQMQNISTPMWEVYTSSQHIAWERFPAIVKPAFEHCSYGITREAVVQSTAELARRVCYILEEFRQPAIVEEFIDSREFHVGVIGNGKLCVLPPGEIDYSSFPDIHDRLCTYESNFDKTSLAYKLTFPKLPVALTKEQMSQLEEIVMAAYRATACRDYARMDVRLRDGIFYLLDANPNPDISSDTSLALGAALIGLPYGKLASLLINLAAQRHPIFGSFDQKK